jgi:hypothetical protein
MWSVKFAKQAAGKCVLDGGGGFFSHCVNTLSGACAIVGADGLRNFA